MYREQSSVVNIDKDFTIASGQKKSTSSTTYVTRVTQETPRQRARRVASENSTFFRFVLSGSIGVIFLVMIMLVGTVEYYEVNAEFLNWLNDDGTFNENSYNLQVTLTNDTPLDNLNGLTLNQVFNENNILSNDFYDWQSYDGGINVNPTLINDDIIRFEINNGGSGITQIVNYTLNTNIYIRFKYYGSQNGIIQYGFIENGVGSRLNSTPLLTIEQVFSRIYSINLSLKDFIFGRVNNQGLAYIYLKDYVLLNLDYLNLNNLNQQQLNDYYDLWQQNKEERSIDIYYGLGDVIVSNYVGFGENVINPASRILDFLTQLIKFGRDPKEIPFDEIQPEIGSFIDRAIIDLFRKIFGGGE